MTLTPEQQKILSGITLETTPKIEPTLKVKSTSTPFTDEQLKMLDSVEVEEEPTVRLHSSQKSAEPEYITVYDRGNTSRKVNKAEYLAEQQPKKEEESGPSVLACHLYTSDAADVLRLVDLGGRRTPKQQNTNKQEESITTRT